MPDESLQLRVQAVHELKLSAEHAKNVFEKAQLELIDYMKANQRKSAVVQHGDEEKLRATLVTPERLKVDEPALKKAVGYKLWGKITVPKLDRKKLEEAVLLGDIDPVVVSQCSQIAETKAYITFKVVPIGDDNDES